MAQAKHLQLASGANPTLYWLANFAWDYCNYLLSAVLCIIVFAIFQSEGYTGRNFPATAVLLLVYGWAIIPMMYPACYYFNVSATAYVSLIVVNLFIGMTATLATYILELFPSDPQLNATADILKVVFLIFPNYCLGRGLMDIARNEYTNLFSNLAVTLGVGGSRTGFVNPLSWAIVGKNIFAMVIQGFVFFGITLLIEFYFINNMSSKPTMLSRVLQPLRLQPKSDGARTARYLKSNRDLTKEDSDVAHERAAATNAAPDEAAVLVTDLAKIYGGPFQARKVAVNRLCFTVRRGECFGLLGVNGLHRYERACEFHAGAGAGKTTTFSMLTGDAKLSLGDAFVNGYSIKTALNIARQHMGYCPQFDALSDLLTGRETLQLFARLRGIKPEFVDESVEHLISNMQLAQYADKPTKTYSGGNKRKLSVAIALTGNPPVVFLDEPTAVRSLSTAHLASSMLAGHGSQGAALPVDANQQDGPGGPLGRADEPLHGRVRGRSLRQLTIHSHCIADAVQPPRHYGERRVPGIRFGQANRTQRATQTPRQARRSTSRTSLATVTRWCSRCGTRRRPSRMRYSACSRDPSLRRSIAATSTIACRPRRSRRFRPSSRRSSALACSLSSRTTS